MKKKLVRIVAAFFLVVFVVGMIPSSVFARTTAEVQKEINEKKEKLNALQQEIEANKANKQAAQTALDEYQAQYNSLVALIDEQEAMIASTEADLDVKTEELSVTIASIESNKALFEERLKAIYEMNSSSAMLATLLTVEDFSDLMLATDAMQRISKHDTDLLTELDTQKKLFEQQKIDLETAITALNEELAQLAENRDWCTQKMAEMNSAIAVANTAIAEGEAESGQTEEEIQALVKELEAIFRESQQRGSKEGDGSARYTGPLLWPVPSSYRITSYYGDPRSNTGSHYGIDIGAPNGSAIVASASGMVLTASYHYSYGNYIIIDHNDGMRTLYAHCSALYVGVGQYVSIGDTIAAVGSTGNSSGNHLHFEVHDHGVRQNPLGSGYLG